MTIVLGFCLTDPKSAVAGFVVVFEKKKKLGKKSNGKFFVNLSQSKSCIVEAIELPAS